MRCIGPLPADHRGFTLIELLIVVGIIGILAAIAIPGYLGMQERGRKGAVTRVGEASYSELQGWLTSAKKTGIHATLIEIDTNGNGAVEATDRTNQQLASNGVVNTWVTENAAVMAQRTPWGNGMLWVDGGDQPTQLACDAVAIGNPGKITVCANPSDDPMIKSLFVVGVDWRGNIMYNKTLTAD